MSEQELKALKATMPWREHVVQTPRGVLVQMVDCNNMEVPIFAMTNFLVLVTAKMASQREVESG